MITLRNTKEPDSLICQFMGLVDDFFREKTDFKTLGYHEAATDSPKVMRLSVFLAEKDYNYKKDGLAWVDELSKYLDAHFPEDDEEAPCPPDGGNSSHSSKR